MAVEWRDTWNIITYTFNTFQVSSTSPQTATTTTMIGMTNFQPPPPRITRWCLVTIHWNTVATTTTRTNGEYLRYIWYKTVVHSRNGTFNRNIPPRPFHDHTHTRTRNIWFSSSNPIDRSSAILRTRDQSPLFRSVHIVSGFVPFSGPVSLVVVVFPPLPIFFLKFTNSTTTTHCIFLLFPTLWQQSLLLFLLIFP